MYGVIEIHNNNKNTLCYLSDIEDIKEFYENKVNEFVLKGFTLSGVKKFKRGKLKDVVRYFNLRKYIQKNKVRISDYYSYNIYKVSNNEIIEKYQSETCVFSKAYNKEKRIKNQVFRASENEIYILNELAKKHKVKPSDIIRASILECFKKDINKIKKENND